MARETYDATIANGTSLSNAVDLRSGKLAAIVMPSGWTAASLTFQVSVDGSTWQDLYLADGTEYTVTAAASQTILMNLVDWLGFYYVKVRSGASGAAVNQGAERVLKLLVA